MIEDEKHFGIMINQTITDMIFKRNDEDFSTYLVESGGKFLSNLSYCYMPFSSLGFGCIIFKNNSFNELYKVKFTDKHIGKIKIFPN